MHINLDKQYIKEQAMESSCPYVIARHELQNMHGELIPEPIQ